VSNLIYTKFLAQSFNGGLDFDAAGTVLRALLERSTSTYAPNKDDDFLDAFTTGGGVEISVGGYSRQTLASKTVTINDANDRIELSCSNLNFGTLAAGQTVKAIIVYQQVGGDDTTPGDDVLICRIDTDSGGVLPVATAGGAFQVTINSGGLIQVS